MDGWRWYPLSSRRNNFICCVIWKRIPLRLHCCATNINSIRKLYAGTRRFTSPFTSLRATNHYTGSWSPPAGLPARPPAFTHAHTRPSHWQQWLEWHQPALRRLSIQPASWSRSIGPYSLLAQPSSSPSLLLLLRVGNTVERRTYWERAAVAIGDRESGMILLLLLLTTWERANLQRNNDGENDEAYGDYGSGSSGDGNCTVADTDKQHKRQCCCCYGEASASTCSAAVSTAIITTGLSFRVVWLV